MPIREYRCGDCGFQFESIDLGRIGTDKQEKKACPNCGSTYVGRKISLFASPSSGSSSTDSKPAPRRFG